MSTTTKQKWHFSTETGKPEVCTATKKKCKYGGETGHENHFSTPEDVMAAMEKKFEKEFGALPRTTKNNSSVPPVPSVPPLPPLSTAEFDKYAGITPSEFMKESSTFTVQDLAHFAEHGSYKVQALVALHPEADSYTLRSLLETGQDEVVRNVLTNRNLPFAERKQFIDNADETTAYAVADNDMTDQTMVNYLAENGSPIVRQAAISNPRVSSNILDEIVGDGMNESNASECMTIVRNPAASMIALRKLADEEALQINIAQHPHIPPNVAAKYTDNPGLHLFLAKNNNVPPSVLEKIRTSDNEYIRSYVASNTNLSLYATEQMKDDPSVIVRYALSQNSSTPFFVLEDLSRDEDPAVRKSVLRNNKTRFLVISELAKDTDPEIAAEAQEKKKTMEPEFWARFENLISS